MIKSIGIAIGRTAPIAALVAALIAPHAVQATPQTIAGGRIELDLRTGSEWNHVKKFGVAKVTLTPQFAVWLEREDGTYAGEIFVTKKAGKSAWGNVRRPEALPVWSHAHGVRAPDGLFMPTKAAPLSDAVSGATPKAKGAGEEIRLELKLPAGLPAGSYRILVELNSSFDYNDTYAENLPKGDPRENGVNGQPSIVYAAQLNLDGSTADGSTAALEFIGAGHPMGSDGTIRQGREGLTSALAIVESISVRNAASRKN
jgi:hypothetical protein